MLVTWKPPSSDGGDRITNYILEMREVLTHRWTQVTKTPNLKEKVTNVFQGKEYEFRVTAFNKAGPSKPSDSSTSFIAKDPYGKN